ncbi:unnamed protein product [Brassica rapa]|uniref:Uncharacterized protein n=2 Tax=Brassica TaxID=3705 RepID=A0A8D9I4Z7_BRACM|nr:unnamed protein product [Brassica napus]CAG7909334.1 unnamed protein product [Brassica rapa]
MDQQPEPVTYVCRGNHLLPLIEKFESELNNTICIESVKDGSFVILKGLNFRSFNNRLVSGYDFLWAAETDQLGLVQAVFVAWSCSTSGLVLFKLLLLLVLGAFAIIGLVQAQDQQGIHFLS